jgi:hypothetical protein
VRTEVVKRRVGSALYQAMEPGDQIIVGTSAMSRYSPAWDLLAAARQATAAVDGAPG